MTFLDALKPYLHPVHGVVSNRVPDPANPLGQSCDNYSLFTAEALQLAYERGEDFLSLLNTHLAFIRACSDTPGSMRRFPTSQGDQSYDEYIGACYSIWRANDSTLKAAFQAYMKRNGGFFDIQRDRDPSIPRRWMYFFNRNIAFAPFFHTCTGKPAGVIGQSLWSLGLLLSLNSDKSQTSGKLLMSIQIPVMEKLSWITRAAVRRWIKGMKKQYSSPRLLHFVYFGDHPLTNYQPEVWP
jgi:hypothetical protein